MPRFLRTLSGFIFNYHKPITLLSLALAVASVFLVLKIELKTDILDVFPSNSEKIRPFKEFIEEFGSTDNLIVVFEKRDGSVLSHIDMIDSFAEKLAASDMTDFVDYRITGEEMGLVAKNFPLFLDKRGLDRLEERLTKSGVSRRIEENRRAILSPFSSPLDMELAARDPLGLSKLVTESLFKESPYAVNGYYTSKDGSLLLIFVKPSLAARDLKALGIFKAELKRIQNETSLEYGDEVEIGFTGPYAVAMEAQSSLKKELLYTFSATAAVILLLFQFVYRKRFGVLLLTAVTIFIALSYTLALAFLLFGGLNIISSIVATMLIGLGIDYIIHSLNRMEEEFGKNGDIERSLQTVFERLMPGIVTGALTTSIAFLSIVITSFKGLHEMGIVAGIGVISNLIATLFFLSAAAVWFAPHLFRKNAAAPGRFSFTEGIIKRRPIVFVLTAAAIIASIALIPGLTFDSDPDSMGQKKSEALGLSKKVSKIMKKSRDPLIALVGSENDGDLFRGYDALSSMLEELMEEGSIGGYSSLDLFLPPLSRQAVSIERLAQIQKKTGDLKGHFLAALKASGFKTNEEYHRYILGVTEAIDVEEPLTLADLKSAGDHRTRLFYSEETNKIAALLYPPEGLKWKNEEIEKISSAVADFTSPGAKLEVTGVPLIFETLKRSIIRESTISSLIAMALITALIYLNFRRLDSLFFIMLPIGVGFILTLGLMRVFGLSFNFINIAAAPLIFGIGVDYGIYSIQGYDENGSRGLGSVGRTVIMCAMTSIAGFGSLMTMSFKGLASLGAVLSIGILSSMVVALVVLPAALSLRGSGKDSF